MEPFLIMPVPAQEGAPRICWGPGCCLGSSLPPRGTASAGDSCREGGGRPKNQRAQCFSVSKAPFLPILQWPREVMASHPSCRWSNQGFRRRNNSPKVARSLTKSQAGTDPELTFPTCTARSKWVVEVEAKKKTDLDTQRRERPWEKMEYKQRVYVSFIVQLSSDSQSHRKWQQTNHQAIRERGRQEDRCPSGKAVRGRPEGNEELGRRDYQQGGSLCGFCDSHRLAFYYDSVQTYTKEERLMNIHIPSRQLQ